MEAVLNEASGMLSGLTRAAGVVLAAKSNVRLKHIEFVRLEPERALVILVSEDGQVENRIITVPAGLPASTLTEAVKLPERACTRPHIGGGQNGARAGARSRARRNSISSRRR